MEPLFTPEEAVVELGVTHGALEAMEADGLIEVIRLPGGARRYVPEEIQRITGGNSFKRPTRKAVRGDSWVVYFAHDPASGLIKIGATADVRRRIASLSKVVPRLALLGHVSGGLNRELEIHERFAEHRERNDDLPCPTEWFRPAAEVLNFIAKTTDADAKQG